MNENCNNLDAYLAGDLTADDATAFAEHLDKCDECREAIDQQQWVDGLLQSPLRFALEPAPQHLADSMHTVVARANRRRTRLVAGALALAASVMIAAGWVQINRQASKGNGDGVIPANVAAGEKPHPTQRLQATFVASSNAIAVPIASRHPDVTIVRIYPAFRPIAGTPVAAIEPEASDNNTWQHFSNGG